MKKIVSSAVLIALCLALLAPLEAFAAVSIDTAAVSLSVLDADMNEITGKIPAGTDFYVRASVTGADGLDFSVYCAVFVKDDILAAFKGNSSEGAGEATVKCSIPQDAGEDYYIKIFVWEETQMAPLNNVLSFNASSPYAAEYAKDGLYTGRELLKDASFENDNMVTDGWDSRSKSRITRSADYVLDGSFSCKVSERKDYYDTLKQDITDALRASGDGDYLVEYNVLPIFGSDTTNRTFRYSFRMYDSRGGSETISMDRWDSLYIYNAEYGKWNCGKAYAKVTLPENMYKAEIYMESSAGTEDFYVDKCSVKKLLTHEEYLKDNAPKDYSDSGMNEYLKIIEACSGSDLVSVYPENSNAVLKNPYKGLNYYTLKSDLSTLNLENEGAQYAKVVYHRFSWKALEPEEGVYNFDIIEQNIEKLKQYNMMLGIGIGSCVTYNGYNSTDNAQNTPDWLFDTYNIPYTLQEVGNGSKANSKVYNVVTVDETTKEEKTTQYIKVPVYNNPVFKEKMQNFLNAFAERFNDNPNIAFVDMRNYGNWGEWHFSSFNDVIKAHSYYDDSGVLQTYTQEDFNSLVDMFKNFRLPLAMFTAQTAQLTYAAEKYNAGTRVDGTMSPNLSDEHRKLTLSDGRNFSVAEWFYQPEVFYEGGTFEAYGDYMPVFLEKVIKEGRVSYMAMGYWDPEDFYQRFPDLVRRIANKTGYWYKISKITYPKKLTSGLFAMTLKNDGSTQLYAGYKRNACVKLALADGSGNILDTVVLQGIDPEDWKAGKYSYVSKSYSFANAANAQKLYLGIFSDADNQNPDIKLGIDEADINGWYDVTAMTSNTYKSDNKLYTASYPYADYGYGYREPYYAFDNNPDTYWASEIRKDEFLEIDFGEYVSPSQMMINSPEAVPVSYSLMGFDGKYWINLCSGDGVNQGENIISFSRERVSKVRLVFNQSSESILKISEMYID